MGKASNKTLNTLQAVSSDTRIPVVITGADIGNDATKTDKGVFFPSKVYEGDAELDFNTLAIKVRWQGRVFIVGDYEKGVTFEKVDKVDKDIYTVALLTAVVLNNPSKRHINTILSIGLPFDFYNNQEVKQYYYDKTVELGEQTLEVFTGKDTVLKYEINVVDAVINAQGAILEQISTESLPTTVVDFGGVTLDITKWYMSAKSKLLNVDENYEENKSLTNTVEIMCEGKSDTGLGFNDVLDNVISDLDTKGKKYKSRQDLISDINKDEIIRLGKDPINLKRIKDNHFKIYAKRVKAFLENNDALTVQHLYFIGGCSEVIKPYVAKDLEVSEDCIIVLPNARFFNAINYSIRAKKLLDKSKYILEDELM